MVTHMDPERLEALKSNPWEDGTFVVPDEILKVPGMLSGMEKQMLFYLAHDHFAGEGVIADLGSCLGGSTICLASGLRQQGVKGRRVIHAFDLFKLGEYERDRFFPENAPPDLRTRAIFEDNVRDYLDLIETHEGDILKEPWGGEAIEMLFVDIAKSYAVFDHLLDSFFPALIPGRSLIILQDYLWGGEGPWHHVVMEKLSDYCTYITDAGTNSVIFQLDEQIPGHVLEACHWLAIPLEEKLDLMDRAIERLDTDRKKAFLRESRELIVDGRDQKRGLQYHEL